MSKQKRLRIAIQKSGRLNRDSMDLLTRCGLKLQYSKSTLFCHVENLPIDILFVRDDDIPTLVMDDICDLGFVGENVLQETAIDKKNNGDNNQFEIIKSLGFSCCRLSIALPSTRSYENKKSLSGLRLATSYPNLLQAFLEQNKINATILNLCGSVEIAPRLNMADGICDLVSTGKTLEENNLVEVETILDSQAVLIKTGKTLIQEKEEIYTLLLRRINGALRAQESKYILFHAPKYALNDIRALLPGSESPTVMPLEGETDKVAVHVVSREGTFWSTLEKLKNVGASAILVLPIEKMLA